MNHYTTLGLERNASDEDIKRAFRRLAMKHHPDRGGDAERFKQIEEAYRVLSDPKSRAQYDNPYQNFGGPSGFRVNINSGEFNFDDIFNMFGTRFHHQPKPQARIVVNLTFADIIEPIRKFVQLRTNQGEHTVELDIPPGIEDGETVQYPGLAPGNVDLLVTYRLTPDARWTRRGANVITECSVSVWELILGATISIQGLRGEHLAVTIPARTEPGTSLRLRGQGLTNRQRQRGDIIVRLAARLPETISPELEQLIRDEINLQG